MRKLTVRLFCAAFAIAAATAQAEAASAVYYSSTPYGPSMPGALSTAGDRAGALISLNNWIGLLFSTPFGVTKSSNVSIFSLPPPVGDARMTISFGVYNGGAPNFVMTKTLDAGSVLSVGNLAQKGCAALGGCDYILITTTRQRNGAPGAVVDYVSIDGQPTEVTEPTPEPSVWAMMLMGFGAVAWRLKSARRSRARFVYSPSSA